MVTESVRGHTDLPLQAAPILGLVGGQPTRMVYSQGVGRRGSKAGGRTMTGMSGMNNGRWVRTSNPANARAFAQERQMEADRRRAAAERSRARWVAVLGWLRSRLLRRR